MEISNKDNKNEILYYEPPPGIFRLYSPTIAHQVVREKSIMPVFSGIKYPKSGGIFTYYLANLHPEKGLRWPVAGHLVATAKKQVLALIGLFAKNNSKWMILPLLGFFLMPRRVIREKIQDFLYQTTSSLDKILERIYMHKRFYAEPVREVRKLIYLLLKNLGFIALVCSRLSEILTNFLQWDEVYLYKVQDIFTMTTKERLLNNPRKEVLYLAKTYSDREPDKTKLLLVIKLLSWGLILPSIKKAFKEAVKHVDIEKIKLTEADIYHCLVRGPYKYLGTDIQIRKNTYLQIHNGRIPPWLELWYE